MGKSGKKRGGGGGGGGGGGRYAESLSDHRKRTENALSTLERVVLAHCQAVTQPQKDQALADMEKAIGVSMQVREMRQAYENQYEELKILNEQVETGKRAERKVAEAEAEHERLHSWFAPAGEIPPEIDMYKAAPAPADLDGAQQQAGEDRPGLGLPYADEDRPGLATRVRPSTNREMVNNLSNPRH